jgi:hypothetical protein
MRTGKFIMGVTAVCALAIATTASAQNPKAVTLNIVDNTLVMETKHNENGCKWTIFETRRDGCIGLGKNEKSEIDFKLKDRKCTLKPGPDREWKLNAVYLGGFNATEPPKEDGYGFSSTPDPDYDKVKSDFTILDRSTGLVKLVKNTDTKLTINDKNEHKYNVWYKIEATCEREGGGDPHVTSYDPRVKNEG